MSNHPSKLWSCNQGISFLIYWMSVCVMDQGWNHYLVIVLTNYYILPAVNDNSFLSFKMFQPTLSCQRHVTSRIQIRPTVFLKTVTNQYFIKSKNRQQTSQFTPSPIFNKYFSPHPSALILTTMKGWEVSSFISFTNCQHLYG